MGHAILHMYWKQIACHLFELSETAKGPVCFSTNLLYLYTLSLCLNTVCSDGRVAISTAMATTSYLHKEQDYVPWSTAIDALQHVDTLLSLRPSYGKFKVPE